MRWQTGEQREAVFYLDDAAGVPQTGLAPTVVALRVSDGTVLPPPAVAEVGSGFYRFTFTAPAAGSYVFLADGGAALEAARFVPLEVPVGGYVDRIDVALSTIEGLIADLGDPAQAADVATLLARLTAARAALLDHLDVDVSTRQPYTVGGDIA